MEGTSLYLNDEACILLTSEEDGRTHVHWGAKTKEAFIKGIKKLCKTHDKKTLYMEFIPPSFVEDLESMGFEIVSEFMDYWLPELERYATQRQDLELRPMKDDESQAVAKITTDCKGSSRGFMGEDEAFIAGWAKDEHSIVLVAEQDGDLMGMCCLNLYGFDSEKGTVLWLREIAVRPSYQGCGIGRALIQSAINWGMDHGAKRSFLSCDADNVGAIGLYQSFGYRSTSPRGQINMQTK